MFTVMVDASVYHKIFLCTGKFSPSNDIKHGSILSPKLFNIYVNVLSISLIEIYI